MYNCRRNRWQRQQQQRRRQQRRQTVLCTASVPACCVSCRLQLHLHLFHPIILVNRRAFAVCALGTGFRPARAHPLAGVGCLHAPCHLSRIVPNSTFCNYKNPREGLRGLQSGGRRLRKQRVGVLWCSLKFVALISIVLCIIVVVPSVAVAVFGIVAAVFSAFSYPGKVYGVLKVRLQLLLLLLLFKCAKRI